MKLLLAIILSVNLAIGVILLGYATFSSIAPTAIKSDFRAFASRVAQDEAAAHALEYGGEDESEDFEYLLDRIGDLGDAWGRVSSLGYALIVSSTVGLVVLVPWRRRDGDSQ